MLRRTVFALLVVFSATPAVSQTAFTPEQEERIGEIIREYLLKNSEVISNAAAELQKRRAAAERARQQLAIAQNRQALERDEGDPVGGNPDGEITVVEFFDYNCPYCRRAKPVVQKLLRNDTRIRYVFKEFPILSETSKAAARVALAVWRLAPEKYWSLHNELMTSNGRVSDKRIQEVVEAAGLRWDEVFEESESKEVASKIADNTALARALDINGTPTFVIGKKLLPGFVPLETLKSAVAATTK